MSCCSWDANIDPDKHQLRSLHTSIHRYVQVELHSWREIPKRQDWSRKERYWRYIYVTNNGYRCECIARVHDRTVNLTVCLHWNLNWFVLLLWWSWDPNIHPDYWMKAIRDLYLRAIVYIVTDALLKGTFSQNQSHPSSVVRCKSVCRLHCSQSHEMRLRILEAKFGVNILRPEVMSHDVLYTARESRAFDRLTIL